MLREDMNIVIVGHVDHGKSTIIGRLLADTGSLPEGKLESVKEMCRRNSKPFEYAFLLDALKDEQAQGITIDSARCFFKTDKRNYIIIDAPGHIEFLKNMVTGAARAEAALLVIDAKEGVKENSKRHGYLLSMLGIKQITVLVNKMDLVDYNKDRFDEIEKEYREFLKSINVEPISFIPISGFFGENIKSKSDKLNWYNGLTILDTLDSFENKDISKDLPFRMPVQSVYKFTNNSDDRRIIAGTVETGNLKVGDSVVFYPSGKKTKVKTIEAFNEPTCLEVSSGYSTGFTMEEQIYVKRGELAVKENEKVPYISTRIKSKLFWLGKEPFSLEKEYLLKIGSSKVKAYIEEIVRVLDASTLETIKKSQVDKNDVAEVIIKTDSPIAFDLSIDIANTSRFVIVDNYEISGGGIIEEALEDEFSQLEKNAKSRDDNWQYSYVNKRDRAERYSQKPTLLLITGDISIDKKEIAKQLEKNLFDSGRVVFYSEIKNILLGLDKNPNLSKKQIMESLGELGNILLHAGNIFIVTIDDLTNEDINILKATLKGDLETIYIGFNSDIEITPDLYLEGYKENRSILDDIKSHLGRKGIIFNSWFYII
ncbi:MAG: GTP-binding protein [Fusobacteriaceae bacterium]|nr:GTP-binding protein [Fusobacteriaceae bacterium]MBN2839299.1 GTP-binding protein [Fusobacteriaceae bacterium]